MDPVAALHLLLILLLGSTTAHDICSQTAAAAPTVADGLLEAHIEEHGGAAAEPPTCVARVERPSAMSRIEVTSVMFSLGNRCAEQRRQLEQQLTAGRRCSDVATNYLRINDHDVCVCRSADESWQRFYAASLSVSFRRASSSAASFAVGYRVQSCDLAALKEYGGYEAIDVVAFDRAAAYCKDSSLADRDGKPTNVTLVTCHFENGTWDRAQRCNPKENLSDYGAELPPSHEVSHLYKPSGFHTDDDGDGHFPKELVGGLAFVLVILVVVVIGATIYTVKRRYKVIVVRRPSRAASTNSRRCSSLTNGGGSKARAAAAAGGSSGSRDEEDVPTAEEPLLPLPGQRPSAPVVGPAPYDGYVVAGSHHRHHHHPSRGDGDGRDGEHEYATPFDPAVGTWSLPSGQPVVGLNLTAATPSQPTAADAAATAFGEKEHYFVLESDLAASTS